MKIATFNINNVNRRLPNLLEWLKAAGIDKEVRSKAGASDHAPTWVNFRR